MIHNYVVCENKGCRKRFVFRGPSDIVECRTFDEFNREVAPREDIFACPSCQRKHARVVEEGDEV